MNREMLLKFLQVVAIIVVCVAVDQWSKSVASARLATFDGGWFAHPMQIQVPEAFDGKTVRDVVTHEFTPRNTPQEINGILTGVTTDMAVMLPANATVKAGDTLEVRFRKITVIKDHFDFEYTRNPGAAFSFLADMDKTYRSPFFIVVGLIALIVIAWILHGTPLKQQLLVWGLAFIAGGAIGNLIDRFRFDYVIDFIVWKYTDAHRWPTFNIADALICIGVGLMIIELFFDWRRERREAKS